MIGSGEQALNEPSSLYIDPDNCDQPDPDNCDDPNLADSDGDDEEDEKPGPIGGDWVAEITCLMPIPDRRNVDFHRFRFACHAAGVVCAPDFLDEVNISTRDGFLDNTICHTVQAQTALMTAVRIIVEETSELNLILEQCKLPLQSPFYRWIADENLLTPSKLGRYLASIGSSAAIHEKRDWFLANTNLEFSQMQQLFSAISDHQEFCVMDLWYKRPLEQPSTPPRAESGQVGSVRSDEENQEGGPGMLDAEDVLCFAPGDLLPCQVPGCGGFLSERIAKRHSSLKGSAFFGCSNWWTTGCNGSNIYQERAPSEARQGDASLSSPVLAEGPSSQGKKKNMEKKKKKKKKKN